MFDLDRWETKPPNGAMQKSQMLCSSTDGIGLWRHGHHNSINVCFADGHVALLEEKKISHHLLGGPGYRVFLVHQRQPLKRRNPTMKKLPATLLIPGFLLSLSISGRGTVPEEPARSDERGVHPAAGEMLRVTPAPSSGGNRGAPAATSCSTPGTRNFTMG